MSAEGSCHRFHTIFTSLDKMSFAFAQETSVVIVASCTQELLVNMCRSSWSRISMSENQLWPSDWDLMNLVVTSRLFVEKLVQVWSWGAGLVFQVPDKQSTARHAAIITPTRWLTRLWWSGRKHMPNRHFVPRHYGNGVGGDALLLLSDRLKADHIVTHHYSCKWCQELPNRGSPLCGLTH